MDDTTRGIPNAGFNQQVKTAKSKKEAFKVLFQRTSKPDISQVANHH